MKDIRCGFKGHFYISIHDEATPDEIEDALSRYIEDLEEYVQDHFALDEYDWRDCNYDV